MGEYDLCEHGELLVNCGECPNGGLTLARQREALRAKKLNKQKEVSYQFKDFPGIPPTILKVYRGQIWASGQTPEEACALLASVSVDLDDDEINAIVDISLTPLYVPTGMQTLSQSRTFGMLKGISYASLFDSNLLNHTSFSYQKTNEASASAIQGSMIYFATGFAAVIEEESS